MRDADAGSELEDGTDQPLLDMNRLQAIGVFIVTSRAFSQYKQRLHQFLHPDYQSDTKSRSGQEVEYGPETNRGGEPMALDPGDRLWIYSDADHPLDDHQQETRSQAEDHPAEPKVETRNESSSKYTQEHLAPSLKTPDHRLPWERDSLTTWVTKVVTDILWPPSKGFQRIWYLCVSKPPLTHVPAYHLEAPFNI